MEHKAGFVNIIGNPNVGKSTLMNALVGEKLSIITSKAQTTRHRIMGIVSGEDFQIVYSDTPGIINPNYKLQESMMKFVGTALSDADIILYVTDIYETVDKSEKYFEKISKTKTPILLLINKIDQSYEEKTEKLRSLWKELLPKAEIILTSALNGTNVPLVLEKIMEKLPEHPAYYSKDELTDRPERFFVSEIIREKILINYKKEIPYSVEIVVEDFKEAEDIIRIRATIHVLRESQKGIIIGHKGAAIKQVGIQSREDMEAFFGKKIFIDLQVKVTKDWREKPNALKSFGY